MTPLADCEALAPLLAAFARGTKRSRLRQLVVACPSGHTLIEVYPTPAGPHAVWQHRHTWEMVDGQSVMTRRLEWMAAPLTEVIDNLGVAEASYLEAIAACRCTEQARVDGQELLKLLATGTRRTVAGI